MFHVHAWKIWENSLYFVQLIGKNNWKEKSNQEVFLGGSLGIKKSESEGDNADDG